MTIGVRFGIRFGIRVVFWVGASHLDGFHFLGKATRPSRRPNKVKIGNAVTVVFRSMPKLSRYQATFLRKARSCRVSSSTRQDRKPNNILERKRISSRRCRKIRDNEAWTTYYAYLFRSKPRRALSASWWAMPSIGKDYAR